MTDFKTISYFSPSKSTFAVWEQIIRRFLVLLRFFPGCFLHTVMENHCLFNTVRILFIQT